METLTIEYQPHVKAKLMSFLNIFEKKRPTCYDRK